jgi:hypothetical protein
MAAVAGDFSFLTAGVLAKLAAISFSTCRDTHAGKMRALALVLRCHRRLLIFDSEIERETRA